MLWKNGIDGLAPCTVAPNLKFVKNTVPFKCNKMRHVCILEYSSVMRKNKIIPFVTMWVVPECIMLSAVSQKTKNKYNILSFVCGI